MKNKTYKVFSNSFVAVLGALALGSAQSVYAQSNSSFAAEPAIVQTSERAGKILLSMSLDHQLFIKAYNDYDNIYDDESTTADDGVAETTYEPRFKYVGYFDTTKCYAYTDGVFIPGNSVDTNGYCTDSSDTANDGGWNGNFLNWLTMTRIDLIRHVLYGGYRSTDSADGVTILERSYLPTDAHSFAKHYTGTDINRLADNLPGGCSPSITGQCLGYTFCNTSKPPSNDEFSQDVNTADSPPLMRVIQGDYSLWASGERLQCLATSEYSGLIGLNSSTGDSGNVPEATGILAFGSEPAVTTNISDFNVRVRVCTDATIEGDNQCQAYVDGETTYYKPTGLLHKYGTAGAVEFGLLTGSYVSNKESGVLRSNVNDFSREVNPKTGQFVKNTDVTPPITNSIVGNLDAFRIVDYRFRGAGTGGVSGGYFGGEDASLGRTVSICNYGEFGFANGRCRNWGNPFSEILAESYRYFSGSEAPTTATTTSSAENNLISGIDGLSVDAWPTDRDDTEALFACANLSIIGFNASTASYDDNGFYSGTDTSVSINDLLGFTSDTGSATVDNLTNVVGGTATHGEFLPGKYFVGGIVGGTVDNECNAKDVTDSTSFAKVRGTCPEAPRLKGSYLGAGLAHYFHTQADKKISTYGVTLAGATPNITVRVSGSQDIILIPACRNKDGGSRTEDPGRCALAAFKAIGVPTSTSGTYMIGWEDTEQGGDYDLDLWGTLKYTYVSGKLTIDTKLIDESTGNEVEFGFIVSGTKTNNDGAYYPAMTKVDGGDADGFTADENTTTSWCGSQGAIDANPRCVVSKETEGGKIRQVQTVTINVNTTGESTAGTFLEEPLYYAAKWGSFVDKSSGVANVPDDISEWKVFNKVTQEYDQMSGYTKVTNPATLNDRLDEIIKSVADRADVATATGVSLSSSTGVGLLVNSLYYPEKKSGDNAISWLGSLTGVLRDFDGYIREDVAPYNGYVDDNDLVIEYVNTDGGGTVAKRSTLGVSGGALSLTEQDRVSVESVRPLWDAQKQLAVIASDDSYIEQRAYDDSASNGRYIITGSRAVDAAQVTETVDFISTDDGLNKFNKYLATTLDDTKLVNYIRGVDYDDMRPRTLDGTKYLLGDMVNSTPKVVGLPSAEYDTRKNDLHYVQFSDQYKNRRQVVYVGANDGMLHAFNAGFANTDSVGFNVGDDEVTNHPLGSELWAYVPFNLLPHLQWLASDDYEHVFYMDGDIQEFDVNIFTPDDDHPGGWGTIIVAGMRLGGGAFDVDGESLKSAYVILDVTNPEVPPKLITEVSAADLGFTAANVELMVNRTPRFQDYNSVADEQIYTLADLASLSLKSIQEASDTQIDQLVSIINAATEEQLADVPAFVQSSIDQAGTSLSKKNKWYLVFGSGPDTTNHRTAESSQTAKLFYLDLNAAVSSPETANLVAVNFSEAVSPAVTRGFVGGLTVVDWDRDFTDDAIYFGLVESSEIPAVGDIEARPVRGRLMQAKIDFTTNSVVAAPTQLLTGTQSTDYPFSTKPFVVADGEGNRWVYAGTGRFYVSGDGLVESPNAYVGVIANKDDTNTADYSDLLDVTDVRLYVDTADKSNYVVAAVNDSTVLDVFNSAVTLDAINTYIAKDKAGWVRRFDSTTELVSEDTAFVNQSLFVTSYDPSESGSFVGECSSPGSSKGYVFDMFNGLPQIRLDDLQTVGGENEQGQVEVTSVQIDYNGYASGATIVNGTKTVRRIEGENDGDADTVIVNETDGSALSVEGEELKATGTGVGEVPPERTSWREISLDEVE